MSKQYISKIAESLVFYRKMYKAAIFACLTQFVIICLLSLAVFYNYFTEGSSKFYATTTNGDIIPLDVITY